MLTSWIAARLMPIGAIVFAGLVGLSLWFWIGWSGAADARDRNAAALERARATIVMLQADIALKERAADERAADTAAVSMAEEELIDAIAEIPDQAPDGVRVRLGCERLRRAGRSKASLPAPCRPAGGSQAHPEG